jgi:hypothetical protein
MAGGIREGAGRKAVKIDLVELEKLCYLQCSDENIASWYGVSVRTIKYRRKETEFANAMRRGKTRGFVNIRRAQMKLLEEGNAAMAVWLGKSELGQRDTSSIRMTLPKIGSAQDLGKAAEKVTQAVARGKLTPAHGETMMGLLESRSRIYATVELGSRVEKIEANLAVAPGSGPKISGLPDPGAEVTMPNPVDEETAPKPESTGGSQG